MERNKLYSFCVKHFHVLKISNMSMVRIFKVTPEKFQKLEIHDDGYCTYV
jgi:hypothetical protein